MFILFLLFSSCAQKEQYTQNHGESSKEHVELGEELVNPLSADSLETLIWSTWHLEENADHAKSENQDWYCFREDGSYLHSRIYGDQDYADRYVEGQWEMQGSTIHLSPLAEYTQIRWGDGYLDVCIDIPKKDLGNPEYRLELSQNNAVLTVADYSYILGRDMAIETEAFLKNKEKYQNDVPLAELLTTYWYAGDAVGGVYADRYMLDESGIFVFANQDEFPGFTPPDRRYSCGEWWVENNKTLCFSATHEIRMTNGVLVEREIPSSERGVTRYEVALLPVSYRGDIKHIQIGEHELWNMGGVSYHDLEDYLYRCYPELKLPNPYSIEKEINLESHSNYEQMNFDEYIIGFWQLGSSTMGSGVAGFYIFGDDHTFYYSANPFAFESSRVDRLKSSRGFWFIENGYIYLTASKYSLVEGGNIVEDAVVGFTIENGDYKVYAVKQDERIIEPYPIEKILGSSTDKMIGIKIGEDEYYSMSLPEWKIEGELKQRYPLD